MLQGCNNYFKKDTRKKKPTPKERGRFNHFNQGILTMTKEPQWKYYITISRYYKEQTTVTPLNADILVTVQLFASVRDTSAWIKLSEES